MRGANDAGARGPARANRLAALGGAIDDQSQTARAPAAPGSRLMRQAIPGASMKSVSDEFDVFDASSARFVDAASVLASNARLTDLLEVLERERDQLDLLLDVTNAVVTQLDTRDLFRAVAPALRRCANADVAALSVYDEEAGVLRHH